MNNNGPKVGNPILFPFVHGYAGDWFNSSQWSNAEFDATDVPLCPKGVMISNC